MFDAIATLIDTRSKPLDKDDRRGLGRRQAEALADACAGLLDHGDVPDTGGRRPRLNVHIDLDDLENRARSAMLDFGGTLTPESLRMLACDAAVVPIVLNGAGQPLDVGRSTRVIPDGLRRAVIARDRGCAHPGCDRPVSWSEIHHILEWEHGGHTKLDNLVMLCRVHHRLIITPDGSCGSATGSPISFRPAGWTRIKYHGATHNTTSRTRAGGDRINRQGSELDRAPWAVPPAEISCIRLCGRPECQASAAGAPA